jgi:hypothetical protein
MNYGHSERISEALERLSASLDRLGIGNACTNMGAIELLALELKNGSERIASAISELVDADEKDGWTRKG